MRSLGVVVATLRLRLGANMSDQDLLTKYRIDAANPALQRTVVCYAESPADAAKLYLRDYAPYISAARMIEQRRCENGGTHYEWKGCFDVVVSLEVYEADESAGTELCLYKVKPTAEYAHVGDEHVIAASSASEACVTYAGRYYFAGTGPLSLIADDGRQTEYYDLKPLASRGANTARKVGEEAA